LYPHERSLAKTFKDKPFVIIGVNSDKDIDRLKSRIKGGLIPSFGTSDGMLRSFWDGGINSGHSGQSDRFANDLTNPNSGFYQSRNSNGTSGLISRRCQVQAWPTACIIDHNGIIRYATKNFKIKTTPAWISLGQTTSLKDENVMVPIIEGLLKSNDLRNSTYPR
jgi:hypothetical protein